ncbi:hypothetical protein FF38_12442 [Lucilia cuprina]|uniref:Uncharacterized protein n=1 Tax=Lucilia cuprina TaxID=7375 RepID=A0A0L0CIT5_LUCCU|nr:hypothetical protein FF38_12442 [Lucilia cuprina]
MNKHKKSMLRLRQQLEPFSISQYQRPFEASPVKKNVKEMAIAFRKCLAEHFKLKVQNDNKSKTIKATALVLRVQKEKLKKCTNNNKNSKSQQIKDVDNDINDEIIDRQLKKEKECCLQAKFANERESFLQAKFDYENDILVIMEYISFDED